MNKAVALSLLLHTPFSTTNQFLLPRLCAAGGCLSMIWCQYRIRTLQKKAPNGREDISYPDHGEPVEPQKIQSYRNYQKWSSVICTAGTLCSFKYPLVSLFHCLYPSCDDLVKEAFKKQEECPACLREWNNTLYTQWTVASLFCKHLICKECKKKWAYKNTCPLCRHPFDWA